MRFYKLPFISNRFLFLSVKSVICDTLFLKNILLKLIVQRCAIKLKRKVLKAYIHLNFQHLFVGNRDICFFGNNTIWIYNMRTTVFPL